MRLKALDLGLILAAAGAVALSAAWAYGPGSGSPSVVVRGRDGEWVYPLSADRTIRVQGPLGETRVAIRGGSVRIEESPCPNQTCVAAGAIREPRQWIACLPNQVMVSVEGGADAAGVDASTY